MIPASVLNDWLIEAQAEYDRVCGFLIGMRDSAANDPVAAGAREMALPHLQKVCDIYLSRVEQLTDIARGVEAEERERTARRSRYDDSFAVLHANGKCRSGFCCAQDTA